MQMEEPGKYKVCFDKAKSTVYFQGALRLGGADEYNEISQMLEEAIQQSGNKLVVNLANLEFLNSSGISVLSKFVIAVRKLAMAELKIIGSKSIPWQMKSLPNLKKLFGNLALDFE